MSSDWKEDSIKRRDERQIKVSDEPNQSLKPAKKKKDTKKWCRGKEGLAHKTECKPYATVKNANPKVYVGWYILVCTECGKELDTYYNSKKTKPDWVIK